MTFVEHGAWWISRGIFSGIGPCGLDPHAEVPSDDSYVFVPKTVKTLREMGERSVEQLNGARPRTPNSNDSGIDIQAEQPAADTRLQNFGNALLNPTRYRVKEGALREATFLERITNVFMSLFGYYSFEKMAVSVLEATPGREDPKVYGELVSIVKKEEMQVENAKELFKRLDSLSVCANATVSGFAMSLLGNADNVEDFKKQLVKLTPEQYLEAIGGKNAAPANVWAIKAEVFSTVYNRVATEGYLPALNGKIPQVKQEGIDPVYPFCTKEYENDRGPNADTGKFTLNRREDDIEALREFVGEDTSWQAPLELFLTQEPIVAFREAEEHINEMEYAVSLEVSRQCDVIMEKEGNKVTVEARVPLELKSADGKHSFKEQLNNTVFNGVVTYVIEKQDDQFVATDYKVKIENRK